MASEVRAASSHQQRAYGQHINAILNNGNLLTDKALKKKSNNYKRSDYIQNPDGSLKYKDNIQVNENDNSAILELNKDKVKKEKDSPTK